MDWEPLWISLRTATLATVLAVGVGVTLAFWRVNVRARWAVVVDALLLVPIVLPPTITGFGLLKLFGRQSPLGAFLEAIHCSVVFTWSATVIAAFVAGLPLMYLATRAAFEQVDSHVTEAARMDGCGKCALLWRVLLPAAWPGVATGALLAFTRGIGEFGATLMFAGNIPGATQTMPIALFFHVEAGDSAAALKLSLSLIALSVIAAFFLVRRVRA